MRRVLIAIAATMTAGCSGQQSALDPAGPVAAAIATTWWVLFWGAALILAIVMALVLYATFSRPESRPRLAGIPFIVVAGLVVPTVVLTALVVYGTVVGRAITAAADDPLRIEVTGHQWWWEVYYPAADGLPAVTTANELYLPAGRPVEFAIRTADVVHSFWIPNLGGKVDMIPGRTNVLRLEASAPGRFRAQCAEFCGAQHARMGFIAIALEPAEFEQWRLRRADPVGRPPGAGQTAFIAQGCADCHTIRGTGADGRGGPELTHFAARPTIGAGTAANSPAMLRAWLADHGHALKPSSHGPADRFITDPELRELLARFLEGLDG